jgi:hypothetical protein
MILTEPIKYTQIINKFFTFNKDGKYTCNVSNCQSILNNDSSAQFHFKTLHPNVYNAIEPFSCPPLKYQNGSLVKIDFETTKNKSKTNVKCYNCTYTCDKENVMDILKHAKNHRSNYELQLKGTKQEQFLFFTFKNQNILIFICFHCDSCFPNSFADFAIHKCSEKKIDFIKAARVHDYSKDYKTNIEPYPARKNPNNIEFIKSDHSILYDPRYNNLNSTEIIGQCDKKTIYKKLGFKKHFGQTTTSRHLQNPGTQEFCNKWMCLLPNATQHYLDYHNQICHTKVNGVKVWKCPHYEQCKFGISQDLLKTYEEWNSEQGNFI